MNLNDLAPEPIMIHLDRPRKLEYRFKAWRYLEAHFGNQEAVLAAVAGLLPKKRGERRGPILENLLYLIWAGLLREDPTLTVDQVEDMLEPARIPEYITAVSRAIAQAFPVPEKDRPPRPGAGASGTGAGPTGSPVGSAG